MCLESPVWCCRVYPLRVDTRLYKRIAGHSHKPLSESADLCRVSGFMGCDQIEAEIILQAQVERCDQSSCTQIVVHVSRTPDAHALPVNCRLHRHHCQIEGQLR